MEAACRESLAFLTGNEALVSLQEEESSLLVTEAYHYLYATVMSALDWYLHADPRYPRFIQANTFFRRGLDNPDVLYLQAVIHPGERYRIWGKKGSAAESSFQIWDNLGCATVDSLDGAAMRAEPDGSFEIFVEPASRQGEAHDGSANTLRQGAGKPGDMILVRLTFPDWDGNCEAGHVHIDWIDTGTGLADPGPVDILSERMRRIVHFIRHDIPYWLNFGKAARTVIPENIITPLRPQQGDVGLLGLQYNSYCVFNLDADEALVLTLRDSAARYVGFQMGNLWFQTLDYHAQTSLSLKQAVKSSDGLYRYVISMKDPGIANWADTRGHRRGFIVLRYQGFDSGVTLSHESDGPLSMVRVPLRDVGTQFTEEDRGNPALFFPADLAGALRAAQVAKRNLHLQRRFNY